MGLFSRFYFRASLFALLTFSACMEQAPPEEVTQIPMAVRYTEYNLWANERMAEWLSAAKEEDWTRNVESSFSSIRSTALHIWSAEYLWLQVLKDESYEENPTRDYSGSPSELIQGWLGASKAFHEYTLGLDASAYNEERGSGTAPLRVDDIIQHCMNHSTYHRGQLITMGRQLGLEKPPQTDYVFYIRQAQKD